MTRPGPARRTARALLTDPDGRVLLLGVHDDVPLDRTDPVFDYWMTVGGGVEPGESFADAIVREVWEETGQRIEPPARCIWRRRASLTDAHGVTRASDEQYFWCRLASAALSTENLRDDERKTIREYRWWSLDDPELSRVRVFPAGFVRAAQEIRRSGAPRRPVWLT